MKLTDYSTPSNPSIKKTEGSTKKPIIGITTILEQKPYRLFCSISLNYARSIKMAGGIPIMLPVFNDDESAEEYIQGLDGLLLTGGDDISPLVYGDTPIKEVDLFNPDRDQFEIKLFRSALENDIPVLGICRGLQLMNVALGGSLYQDIFVQVENCLGHCAKKIPPGDLYHPVKLIRGSKLRQIFGQEVIQVNSYHHQSVKQLAENFWDTACSADGIVEGIEHKTREFVIAVQWHPEDLTDKHTEFVKLFEAFTEASSRKKIRQEDMA